MQPIHFHRMFADLSNLPVAVDDVEVVGEKLLLASVEHDGPRSPSDEIQLPTLVEGCFPKRPFARAIRASTGKKRASRNPHRNRCDESEQDCALGQVRRESPSLEN